MPERVLESAAVHLHVLSHHLLIVELLLVVRVVDRLISQLILDIGRNIALGFFMVNRYIIIINIVKKWIMFY